MNLEEKTEIFKLIKEYKNIFYQPNSDLTFTHAIKHKIRTINDVPIFSKSYRYPYIHKNEVKNQVQEMLDTGIIRPSNSTYR